MAMIFANHQVQNSLRAYGQQMTERSRLSKVKVAENSALKDQMSISPESKKRLSAEKVAKQLINQFGNGNETSDTGREILKRLNREYGQILHYEAKEDQGLSSRFPTKPDLRESGI
jgi:hypothetical protein